MKKTYDKAKCQQKAIVKGTVVDPSCLAKAVIKADAAGTCLGTAAGLEATVDRCVDAFVSNAPLPQFPATGQTTCWNNLNGRRRRCSKRPRRSG